MEQPARACSPNRFVYRYGSTRPTTPETSNNFITGICDGLMAAHPQTPVDPSVWEAVPEAARPNRAIVFADDRLVTRIEAARLPPDTRGPRCELELAVLEGPSAGLV